MGRLFLMWKALLHYNNNIIFQKGYTHTAKDDTLPCKCQALAWQKVPKAWTQALWRYKDFFYQSVMK